MAHALVLTPEALRALQVAAMLNGQQMGGKRRSAYHYDLWSMKYLPKFKWDHLTEEVGARPAAGVCRALRWRA